MPLQVLVLVAVVALVLKQQRQFMLLYPLSDGYCKVICGHFIALFVCFHHV
jgi:hypothetical protein